MEIFNYNGIANAIMEFMKRQQGPDDATVEKTWVQAGKLSPEDEGRRRGIVAKAAEREREFKMYAKKMAALRTQNDAESDEWWNHVHKTYGLPEGNYHVHDDGRIFCEPKNK